MAQAKNNNRNIIIAIAIMGLVITVAIGLGVWLLSGDGEERVQDSEYSTQTPSSDRQVAEIGSISIDPQQIQMIRGLDGTISGTATISALNQPFTVQRITVDGDSRISATGDCITSQPNYVLGAGNRCVVRLTLRTDGSSANPSSQPLLVVVGETLTPGGDRQTLETSAPIIAGDPAAASDPQAPDAGGFANYQQPGQVGPLAPGQAPVGIDPYGPVTAPPVDYAQAPVSNAPPPLTPREQFILARRQAVLGNVVRRPATPQQQAARGDWDEIGVPRTISSYPQDMSRVVTMDRVITAVLSRTFDSRQSQQVVAQVDRNVYGGSGRNVLIPRGSTIIGTMQGGADRVAVIWSQIIRPDGARFVFQGQGGDAVGQAGVPGNVNNRWLRRISAGLLGTVLKVGTAVASGAREVPNSGNNVNIGGGAAGGARNTGAIITDIVTQDITQALQPFIQQAQQIQPIITVPAGTRVTIMPTQDLVMREVRRETIVTTSYPRQMNSGAQISEAPQAIRGAGGDIPLASSGGTGYGSQQQARGNIVEQGLASGGRPAELGSTPPWGNN